MTYCAAGLVWWHNDNVLYFMSNSVSGAWPWGGTWPWAATCPRRGRREQETTEAAGRSTDAGWRRPSYGSRAERRSQHTADEDSHAETTAWWKRTITTISNFYLPCYSDASRERTDCVYLLLSVFISFDLFSMLETGLAAASKSPQQKNENCWSKIFIIRASTKIVRTPTTCMSVLITL